MYRTLAAALSTFALLAGSACSNGHHDSRPQQPNSTANGGRTRLYAAPVVLHARETRSFPKSRLRAMTTLACLKTGQGVTLLVSALGNPKPMQTSIPGGPRLQTSYRGDGTMVATCR